MMIYLLSYSYADKPSTTNRYFLRMPSETTFHVFVNLFVDFTYFFVLSSIVTRKRKSLEISENYATEKDFSNSIYL